MLGLDVKLESRFEVLKDVSIRSHENMKALAKLPMMTLGPGRKRRTAQGILLYVQFTDLPYSC